MGEWRRIGDLFDFEKGSLQSSKCTPGEYTFITAAEEWKTHNDYTHDCEALMFAMGASGSLGRTHYFKGKFISSDLCFILQPKKNLKLDLTFYFYIFNFLRAEIVKKTAKGTSKLAINQENFCNYLLPYFDYEHQLAFREKLKNVAGITDSFDSETTNQLDFLKQLRQALLQEAVEGKLTADWRKQYPVVKGDPQHDAAALLAQIKAEKERLIEDGKFRKEKPLEPIAESEKPIDLPSGWVWCRLTEICDVQDPNPSHRMPKYVQSGIPFISTMNVDAKGKINFSIGKQVAEETFQLQCQTYSIMSNSFAFSRIGTIGFVFNLPLPQNYCLSHSLSVITPIQDENEYLMRLLSSPTILRQATHGVTKNTVPDLGMKTIRSFVIPLPPLAEQQAIVARVDSLMATIDALEAQVSERKEQAQQLMQAVLREAFAGGADMSSAETP